MSKDALISYLGLAIVLALLFLSVPKSRIREAALIVLFMQSLAWVLGLIVVQMGLIVYPYRQLPNATATSFNFEFIIYPSVSVIFNLHYPAKRSIWRRMLYYAAYCSVITAVEIVVEQTTDIIQYIHWRWYFTWLSLLATIFLSRRFYLWFFRREGNETLPSGKP